MNRATYGKIQTVIHIFIVAYPFLLCNAAQFGQHISQDFVSPPPVKRVSLHSKYSAILRTPPFRILDMQIVIFCMCIATMFIQLQAKQFL